MIEGNQKERRSYYRDNFGVLVHSKTVLLKPHRRFFRIVIHRKLETVLISDMQIARWRNILSMKNHIIPSVSHFSAFHSTPCSCHKWNNNPGTRKGQEQPSKNQIKFVTRQKRADAKKALKHLLYSGGSSKFSFEDKKTNWKLDGNSDAGSNSYSNKGQPKSGQRFGGKPQKKNKRKIRRERFCEDEDDQPEQIFHATFGNRSYTWSFCNMRGSSSEHSTYGFEWREHTNKTNTNKWRSASDDEDDGNDKVNDSCRVGSSSDRTILGLPPTGPLKIEDVKNAFRLSALKWHPDKHQGPSQAMAEEKFKLCVNSYKTLCNALSPA